MEDSSPHSSRWNHVAVMKKCVNVCVCVCVRARNLKISAFIHLMGEFVKVD